MKLFYFISTDARDTTSVITIATRNEERANKLVQKSFIKWGYKGLPQKLAI